MRWLAALVSTILPSVAFAEVSHIAPEDILKAVSLPGAGSGYAGYLVAAHAFGVAAVAAIAVVMIVWGAIGIFGENVWGKGKGKERVQNALLGLLLAAGSYVILKTVSDSLLNASFQLKDVGADSTTGVAITSAVGTGAAGSATAGATGSTNGTTGTTGETTGNRPWTGSGDYSVPAELSASEYDAYVRTLFGGNGISVNKNYAAGSSSNTNLNGLQEVAIQGIITMKGQSGVSSITVTGGTEPGHAGGTYSHASGYKIDIRPDGGDFDNYITTNFTSNGTRSGDASYVKNYGTYTATAVRESDHWDIQFKPN